MHSPGVTGRHGVAALIQRTLLSSTGRSGLLGLLFAAPAAVLGLRLASLPAAGSPEMPFWVLAALFFVTERVPLSQPQSHTLPAVAISSPAVVIALFLSSPSAALGGLALGSAAAALTRRPLRLVVAAAAVVQATFFMAVAVALFRPLVSPEHHSWQSWAAAGAAAALFATGRAAGVALLAPDRHALDAMRNDARVAVVVFVAGACFGLLSVILIRLDAPAMVLVALTGATMLLVYRRLNREHQLRAAAEFLQDAGDALQRSPGLETAVVRLLTQARVMFGAEIAQLTIFPAAAGDRALRTTVRRSDGVEVMAPLALVELDDVLEADTDGAIVRPRTSPSAADMLQRRGIGEAMVALLRGESRMLGSLLVGGHVDARPFDARDLQLFQTLAIQTTTTLEKGKLERSFARLTELQAQLSHQALHDSLTDLANRTLFGERIDQALARSAQGGRRVAVIFIDLDEFKGVNDTLGHHTGDALLVGVAERLRTCLRRPDTAARLGGDEFAVLLEDIGGEPEAIIVARRIFDALRAPFDVGAGAVTARASLGVAVADSHDDNAENLMQHADVAMYAAKAAGKDRYVVFAPGMEAGIVTRHRLRSELERAIDDAALALHYQPIVDLCTGRVVGLEALVRWRHPQRGLVGPSDFIPLAEETGQILEIGDFVLRTACSRLLRWQARFPALGPLSVSVNISARQLQQPMFVERVSDTTRTHGLRPESLTLELTETILLEDASSNIAKLETLRRSGIRIAIDDFGTGYSSLSYLRRLPVDTLKIAKPFIDDLAAEERDADFARAIIGIGTALRLELVAEGIESAAQLARLLELGCTRGQGYHLSEPLDAEHIDELFEHADAFAARVTGSVAAGPKVITLAQR